MSHIVESCPLTKLNGGFSRLHSADEDDVSWLTSMKRIREEEEGPQNWGFGGLWTPNCDYSSSRTPKGTSLHRSSSFKLSTVKIRRGV